MVEKEEGAKMTCKNCGTHLICRTRHYKASGNFPEKTVLQWQNENETAHYSTKNGKDFTCNISEDQENSDKTQNKISEEQSLSRGESTPEIISLATLDKKLNIMQGVIQSILHIVADMKTGVKSEK